MPNPSSSSQGEGSVVNSTAESGTSEEPSPQVCITEEVAVVEPVAEVRKLNLYSVMPTPVRLDSHPGYTGKGVTIAFLDSGFYPHPDLVEPSNRILAYMDVTGSGDFLDRSRRPEFWHWHGAQTSVVAAGNGGTTQGAYRGLAPDCNVVLVQVGHNGKIRDEYIVKGLRWVIDHREQYDIRVLNISVGGWEHGSNGSFTESEICRAAEEAVDAGIVVVAAAGNDGSAPTAPANAPSVLTVGGFITQDVSSLDKVEMYTSNFGWTVDLVVKPEVIAPAAYVAAPVLPNTLQKERSDKLLAIYHLADDLLIKEVQQLPADYKMPEKLWEKTPDEIREALERKLRGDKMVVKGYQHVDGTSFAAPIVSSLVAQMLECNPDLSPAAVRQILMSTADKVRGVSTLRQGCGVVNSRRAVQEAKRSWTPTQISELRPPSFDNGRLSFVYVNIEATTVHLSGDFNEWESLAAPMEQILDGLWRIEVEAPPAGKYRYKFLVDEANWVEDPANLYKQPNIYGGFDSVLFIT
jgi:serine protease AprX